MVIVGSAGTPLSLSCPLQVTCVALQNECQWAKTDFVR